MPRWAGTTTQRGLGATHQNLRRHKLTALIDGTPCRRCGHPRYHPNRCPHGPCALCTLDLGHPDDAPRALTRNTSSSSGGCELEHTHCNRKAGARLGNKLRGRTRQHTRRW